MQHGLSGNSLNTQKYLKNSSECFWKLQLNWKFWWQQTSFNTMADFSLGIHFHVPLMDNNHDFSLLLVLHKKRTQKNRFVSLHSICCYFHCIASASDVTRVYCCILFRTQIITCKTFRAVAFLFFRWFLLLLLCRWTAAAVVVLKLYSKRSNFSISVSNFNIQFYVWFHGRATWQNHQKERTSPNNHKACSW